MIKLNELLNADSLFSTKMLLQIHDELIFESPEKEFKKIIPIIKKNMVEVSNSEFYKFSVPLTVDVNFGDNWEEAH